VNRLKINDTIIHTIIFDFDGTLAKLTIDFQQMQKEIMKLLSSYGLITEALHANFILEMIHEAFEILNQRNTGLADGFLAQAKTIIEKIEIEAAGQGELLGYTKELLMILQSQDFSYGIITRNCVQAIKIVFPDILSYCPVLVCRDDVVHVKPHPEHIHLALSKLDALARNTLMIGDHPIDIMTGKNAGTATCGVLTGKCSKEEFLNAGADIILADVSHIIDWIK